MNNEHGRNNTVDSKKKFKKVLISINYILVPISINEIVLISMNYFISHLT